MKKVAQMIKKASQRLGEPIEYAVRVTAAGAGARAANQGAAQAAGGIVGGLIAHAMGEDVSALQTPAGYERTMYMVVTASRVVFFEIVIGLVTTSPGAIIAEYKRDEVRGFSVGASKMAIPFFIMREFRLEFECEPEFHLEVLTLPFYRTPIKRLDAILTP